MTMVVLENNWHGIFRRVLYRSVTRLLWWIG